VIEAEVKTFVLKENQVSTQEAFFYFFTAHEFTQDLFYYIMCAILLANNCYIRVCMGLTIKLQYKAKRAAG